MPFFKFQNPEEQSAFIQLMSLIPRRQRWDDVERYPIENTCHICNGNISVKLSVKSGMVPLDNSFENDKLNGYTFWNCCSSCHSQGWQLPYWVSRRGGIRYWRIDPTNKTEERIITDFPIFKFPSIVPIGLDTVSINL